MSRLRLRLLLCTVLTGWAGCGSDGGTTAIDPQATTEGTAGDASQAAGADASQAAGADSSQAASGESTADAASMSDLQDEEDGANGPVVTPQAGSDAAGDDAVAMGEANVGAQAPAMDEGSEQASMFEGNFSFFVTSLDIMRELSGSADGFGGDLGGIEGADEICRQAAATQGAGDKTWRAFLSTSEQDAIDRIGDGPWYDRNGRLVSEDLEGLLGTRPMADDAIVNNLPNERGEPLNQDGADDHDVMTGSNAQGRWDMGSTCDDWTSTESSGRGPMLGHAWPRGGGRSEGSGSAWIESHRAPGCAAGVVIEQLGGASRGATCVGCAGGYGGIYCFALEP